MQSHRHLWRHAQAACARTDATRTCTRNFARARSPRLACRYEVLYNNCIIRCCTQLAPMTGLPREGRHGSSTCGQHQIVFKLHLTLLAFAIGGCDAVTVTISNASPRLDTSGQIMDCHECVRLKQVVVTKCSQQSVSRVARIHPASLALPNASRVCPLCCRLLRWCCRTPYALAHCAAGCAVATSS
eukprot:COSAG02_NODE_3379_length_6839_cov_2.979970_4_plen_186_part_00